MGVFNTTIRWEDIMSLQKNLSVKTDSEQTVWKYYCEQ
jgi:hypothetical protein